LAVKHSERLYITPHIAWTSREARERLTYFYAKNPKGNAVARIVFPYNPNPEKSFWEGVIGRGKPLEADEEAWVENQFWDFCSGLEDTYAIISESFDEIRQSKVLEKTLDALLHNSQ
jgi:hypothetical protein